MKALLFTLVALAGSASGVASPQTIVLSAELPPLQAKTLAGGTVNLPKDGKGRGALLVVAFSKAAANPTRAWTEACRSTTAARPASTRTTCYDVRMVEDVPRLFRGLVERAMRSGLPTDLQKSALLIYSDNASWRKRLDVADADSAYVVACDKEGRVRATARGAYTQKELERLLALIEG